MNVYTIAQALQYCNILVKAEKGQPSLQILNKIVNPINIQDDKLTYPRHIVPVIDNESVSLSKLLQSDITAEVYFVHNSNLINLN